MRPFLFYELVRLTCKLNKEEKKMKKNLTELVFILDRSGSMGGKEDDVIGSFNSTLNEHKKENVLVTTVLFNDNMETVHDRVDIKEIKDMTRDDFVVSGCTALIDALGSTIVHIKDIHKYARKEDVPNRTLFAIMTDGLENASHKYSSDEVKKMVEAQKEKGWDFLYLAANIDAVETAKQYGISEDMAINYHNDRKGIRNASKAVGNVMNIYASLEDSETLTDSAVFKSKKWRKEADKDFEERK